MVQDRDPNANQKIPHDGLNLIRQGLGNIGDEGCVGMRYVAWEMGGAGCRGGNRDTATTTTDFVSLFLELWSNVKGQAHYFGITENHALQKRRCDSYRIRKSSTLNVSEGAPKLVYVNRPVTRSA
jgi:hypothetical protein